jgi:nicotinamidase-related amidase
VRRAVHLPIDFQSFFFSESRGDQEFCLAVRDFSSAIRPIPTIWVAFGSNFRFHNPPFDRATEFKCGQLIPETKSDELVFEKKGKSPFEDPLLRRHLKRNGVSTVIITGVDTLSCIASTISGALKCRLRCIVISDLLATISMDGESRYNLNPEYNSRLLEMMFPKPVARSEISFSLKSEFIAAHNQPTTQPNRPTILGALSRIFSISNKV